MSCSSSFFLGSSALICCAEAGSAMSSVCGVTCAPMQAWVSTPVLGTAADVAKHCRKAGDGSTPRLKSGKNVGAFLGVVCRGHLQIVPC